MVDEASLDAIIKAASVEPNDTVVEIGGGAGALTQALARRAGAVHCLEVDEALVGVLSQALADFPNVTLHHVDALKFPYESVAEPYSVVANIPYQITAPLVELFVAHRARLKKVTLTVQLEVARRLCASPGTKDYGVFSVVVAFYFETLIHAEFPPDAFWPPPKVGSAVVTLSPRAAPPVEVGGDEKAFLKLVRLAFAHRRKTLRNNLKALGAWGFKAQEVDEALSASGIDGTRRAETLSLEEFAALWRALGGGR
jgi:16S rRNA (adenine1518-N6/adenine1519-N6)-dimethyltransferase